MSTQDHRYRITVTPIERGGQPCPGRCTIEFEHASHSDWMRLLESMQRQRGFTGDERAALTVGSQLLGGLMLQQRSDADEIFAPLRPHLDEFITGLKQRNSAA